MPVNKPNHPGIGVRKLHAQNFMQYTHNFSVDMKKLKFLKPISCPRSFLFLPATPATRFFHPACVQPLVQLAQKFR
eukprot:1151401-Pelagomonas_calceolata.AAC.3